MSKKLDQWRKNARHTALRAVLDLPEVKEALAILEEHVRPTQSHLARAAALPSADGAFYLALNSSLQTGVAFTLDLLQQLAQPPPDKQIAPAPYAHITETYFDNHGTSTTN